MPVLVSSKLQNLYLLVLDVHTSDDSRCIPQAYVQAVSDPSSNSHVALHHHSNNSS
jgi:hypothetical protein